MTRTGESPSYGSCRLDGEHSVDAALDELIVDVGVDREDAPLVAAAGR